MSFNPVGPSNQVVAAASANSQQVTASQKREEDLKQLTTFAESSKKIQRINFLAWNVSILKAQNLRNPEQEEELKNLGTWLAIHKDRDVPREFRLNRYSMIKKIFGMIDGNGYFAKMPIHYGDENRRVTSEQLANSPFIREHCTYKSGPDKGSRIESIWIRAMVSADSKSGSIRSQGMVVCIEVERIVNYPNNNAPRELGTFLYLEPNRFNHVFDNQKSMSDLLFLNPANDFSKNYLGNARHHLLSLQASCFINSSTFFPFFHQLEAMNLYHNSGFAEFLRDVLLIPNDLIPIILNYSFALPSLQINLEGQFPDYKSFLDEQVTVAKASDPA